MGENDVFRRIAFDSRLVTPGKEQARGAFEVLNSAAPVAVRRMMGRDVLVKVAREYRLGNTVADSAEGMDVPGTEANPY